MDEESTGASSPELRQRGLGSNSPNWSNQRRGSIPRSFDDMSDIGPKDHSVNEDNVIYTTEMAPRSLNIAPRSHRLTYPTSLMKTTSSSPNLLNEICEENESDFEESPRNSPKAFRRQPRRQRKYEKKRPSCRLSPIHSRRSSCSSSDDEEFQKLDRRLNIQVAISAARVLPNVPENSGDKENNGDRNECGDGGKKSLDLLERFFESEKESTLNLMNYLDTPSKLFVTSVSGRVRNLSDTNLVSYQARYRLPILKDVKCSSDTNLAVSFNGNKALIQRQDMMKLSLKQNQFVICNSPTLSSASPIEEENPSDISPDSSPVAGPKHGLTYDCTATGSSENTPVNESNLDASLLPASAEASTPLGESRAELHSTSNTSPVNSKELNVCKKSSSRKASLSTQVIDADEFSSIQDSEEGNSSTLQVGSKDSARSRSGSKSSLKYHYNEFPSGDENSCYTIVETRPVDKENLINDQSRGHSRTQTRDVPAYSVGRIGRIVVDSSVRSKCCTIV